MPINTQGDVQNHYSGGVGLPTFYFKHDAASGGGESVQRFSCPSGLPGYVFSGATELRITIAPSLVIV